MVNREELLVYSIHFLLNKKTRNSLFIQHQLRESVVDHLDKTKLFYDCPLIRSQVTAEVNRIVSSSSPLHLPDGGGTRPARELGARGSLCSGWPCECGARASPTSQLDTRYRHSFIHRYLQVRPTRTLADFKAKWGHITCRDEPHCCTVPRTWPTHLVGGGEARQPGPSMLMLICHFLLLSRTLSTDIQIAIVAGINSHSRPRRLSPCCRVVCRVRDNPDWTLLSTLDKILTTVGNPSTSLSTNGQTLSVKPQHVDTNVLKCGLGPE
ncbi:hypothetical protein J6590_016898 [Homalodisca vitripennis]|nr:hypothetical protein J6590_016898 [Homalodisca vitripennis]